jgi:hypothetical protein
MIPRSREKYTTLCPKNTDPACHKKDERRWIMKIIYFTGFSWAELDRKGIRTWYGNLRGLRSALEIQEEVQDLPPGYLVGTIQVKGG